MRFRLLKNYPEWLQNCTHQCRLLCQTGTQQAKPCLGWALSVNSKGQERTWGFLNSPALAWKSPKWTLQASCVMHRCLDVREPYNTGFLSRRRKGTQRPNPGLPSSGPISLASSTYGGCRSSLPACSILSPCFGKQAHYPLGDDKDRYALALPGQLCGAMYM